MPLKMWRTWRTGYQPFLSDHGKTFLKWSILAGHYAQARIRRQFSSKGTDEGCVAAAETQLDLDSDLVVALSIDRSL